MIKKALVLPITALAVSAAYSQTQGVLGATSQGEFSVFLQVLDSVRISGLEDIDLGSFGGSDTGDVEGEASFCVYVNGQGSYRLTPTSANGKKSFVMAGDGNEIEYTLKLAGTADGASVAAPAVHGSASNDFIGSQFLNCEDTGDNAQVRIEVAEQEIRQAATGNYSDTITLLLNPT